MPFVCVLRAGVVKGPLMLELGVPADVSALSSNRAAANSVMCCLPAHTVKLEATFCSRVAQQRSSGIDN